MRVVARQLRTQKTLYFACVIAILLPLSGGHQFGYDPVVWKSEARSLDGAWIATMRTDQWGGFGTAWVETTVSIRKVDGTVNHGKPFDILSYPGGGQIPKTYTLSEDNADRDLQVSWTAPKHLKIAHKSFIEPDLEVIRFSDVDITFDLAQ